MSGIRDSVYSGAVESNLKVAGMDIMKNQEPSVFIIGELSANHNGSLDHALKIVDAIADAGADAASAPASAIASTIFKALSLIHI